MNIDHTMENTHRTVENVLENGFRKFTDFGCGIANKYTWFCTPRYFFLVINILVPLLVPLLTARLFWYVIVLGLRLAIGNADRAIFILAAPLLTWYQVPHTAFYVYVSVISFRGCLQVYDTKIRLIVLHIFESTISMKMY